MHGKKPDEKIRKRRTPVRRPDKIELAIHSAVKGKTRRTGIRYDIRKSIGNFLFLAVFFLVVARIISVVAGLPSPFAVVASRSMMPTLGEGDIVIWSPVRVDDVSIGDIIVFRSATSEEYIVHRVVDITVTSEGKRGFITQGDANPYPDQTGPSSTIQPVVTERSLIGRVVSLGDIPLKVPGIGSIWLWFTHAFPSSPRGMAFIGYAIAGVMIVFVFLVPSEKPSPGKNLATVILGRRQVKLFSLGVAFFLITGLVLASASAGGIQESSISIGVGQRANPATLRIDYITHLESINASLFVENPSGLPLKGMIFVTGAASEFIPFNGRVFEIAPYQTLNLSIPVHAPADATPGVYDGIITIYFSAFWWAFPPEWSATLVNQYGQGSVTIINMLITLEITLIFFGTVYLIIRARDIIEPYSIYLRMKGIKRHIRRRRIHHPFHPLRDMWRSVSRWVSTIPLIPVNLKDVFIISLPPLIFLPGALFSPYFSILSGVVACVLTRIYLHRELDESLASGVFAVAITLLSTYAPVSLILTVIAVSPLIGLLAYFSGMRYRGEIIMTAQVFTLVLILGVILLPCTLSPVTPISGIMITQSIGISLLIYLIVFLPVLVLAYIPPLIIHSWKEHEDPALRIRDLSDL